MSPDMSWKKAPKPSPSEVVEQRVKELRDRGRAVFLFARRDKRGRGTPRSVIFSKRMDIPKTRRRK